MTQKQRITARKIVEALVDRADASAAELCEATGVSRPTVLSVINALADAGIVSRKGVRYGFYGGCSAVILRAFREKGEIVSYSLGEGEQGRIFVDFSPMLSYADNVRGLAKRAEGYSDFLRKRGKVFTCFICGEDDALLHVPAFFDLSLNRDSVLAEALFNKCGRGSLLYAERGRADMLLSKDGIAVKRIDGGACSLRETLALLKPDAVAVDSVDCEEITQACRDCKIRVVDAYGAEEREVLVRLVCEKI